MRAETIHLTLVFLGDMPEGSLAGLVQTARQAKVDSHVMLLEQAKYWRHNRIVWAGPHKTPAPLEKLVENLRNALAEMKFKAERAAFAAHVTLIRNAREPGELPRMPAVAWPIEEYVLARSLLGPQGPSYEVVGRFSLR